MNNSESHVLASRNVYRNRRNVIRRFFFLFFIIVIFLFCRNVYFYIASATPQLEVINNSLVNQSYIINEVFKLVNNKNFFLISPREISNYLMDSNHLLKHVVVRKYIFPGCKILILLKEKNIWAVLVNGANHRKAPNINAVVTDDGDVVPTNFLLFNKLPKTLLPIYVVTGNIFLNSSFCILKDILTQIKNNVGLDVEHFLITYDNQLEIYSTNGIKINVGKLDSEINDRILKLGPALRAIEQSSYIVDYIDLTLENAVVFKKHLLYFKNSKIQKTKK